MLEGGGLLRIVEIGGFGAIIVIVIVIVIPQHYDILWSAAYSALVHIQPIIRPLGYAKFENTPLVLPWSLPRNSACAPQTPKDKINPSTGT